MTKVPQGQLTPTQLMLAAKAKLLGVQQGLVQFGERANMDPYSLARVENTLIHLEEAIHALSASAEHHEGEDIELPF